MSRPAPRLVFSGGLLLTLGAVVQAGIGFVAQLVLMRLLVPDDFGGFAIVSAGCSLVQTILSLRLNILIIRTPDSAMTLQRSHLYRAALVWETVLCTVITMLWLWGAGLISAYALILVGSMAVAQWTNQMAAFYERRMAYGHMVAVETGSNLVGHAVAIAMVWAGMGAVSLYAREAVVALTRLGGFTLAGALMPPCWRLPGWSELRALLAEARSLWLDGVMEGGFARIVVLGAGSVTDLHGTGVFTQSQRLAGIPHQLLSPVVVRLAANVFSRTTDHRARVRLLLRLLAATVAGLAVMALAAVWWGEPVIPWLFGQHWQPAARVVAAMAGVIVFLSAFELLRVYCLAVHRVGPILAGRVAQYALFLAALALAVRSDAPVSTLAAGLSLSYMAAFVVAAGCALLARPPIRAR